MDIRVERAQGNKCPRCWKYSGILELPQGICDGCALALLEIGFVEHYFHTPDEQRAFECFQEEIRLAYHHQKKRYLLDKII